MKQFKIKTLKKLISCIKNQQHLLGSSFDEFLRALRNAGYLDTSEIRVIQALPYDGCNCPDDMLDFFNKRIENLKSLL